AAILFARKLPQDNVQRSGRQSGIALSLRLQTACDFFHAPGTDAAILRTAQPTLYAVSHNAVSATHFHVQYQRRTSATAEGFRSVAPVGLHQIQTIPQGNRDRHAHQVLVEEVYIQVCLVVPAQEE
ncbi:hypothetical protein ACMZ6L_28970, partial [Klebsiella pneumoniae]|uniref:hypothetical protein n=1 Tax=Klebsiella pneumoniae TaxID=573 RepID=UPI0039F02043